MAQVEFVKASHVYPGAGRAAVDELSLTVEDGEFMVLVGPSGCGKSTSLRMLAGLEEVTTGSIRIGDVDITDVAPKDRDIAMVFQNYALYPHLSVADNMAFALKIAGVAKAERRARVQEAARMLDLVDVLDRKPRALSGGQRQRVAMGRAIVRQPQVFCMDEPLSNLDAKLRVSTRTQIAALQRRLGTTTVYVTHDQVEAMTMGDRVAVMKDGVLQQVDTPLALYDRPANAFVAGFIGSPSMNLLSGSSTAAARPWWTGMPSRCPAPRPRPPPGASSSASGPRTGGSPAPARAATRSPSRSSRSWAPTPTSTPPPPRPPTSPTAPPASSSRRSWPASTAAPGSPRDSRCAWPSYPSGCMCSTPRAGAGWPADVVAAPGAPSCPDQSMVQVSPVLMRVVRRSSGVPWVVAVWWAVVIWARVWSS